MISLSEEHLMQETDPYVSRFEAFEKETLAPRDPSWVYAIRKAGIARFAELGFPTLKHEDWRFTNVAPIKELPFAPRSTGGDGVESDQLAALPFHELTEHRLVFVDGQFNAALSRVGGVPEGVILGSLREQIQRQPDLIRQHLARYTRGDENAFAALNTAFFLDGAFLYVPRGKEVESPVHLIYLTTGGERGLATFPRNLVVAEAGSRLTVLESYHTLAEGEYFTNAGAEFVIGDEAVVEHCKYQDENEASYHIATLQAHLGRQANFLHHSFALGARLSRGNLRTTLDGEGLECVLNGLYLTRGEQLADHHMVVEHAKPHTESHEYFNGILDDRSKGVFHGRILVRQEAQKTDAKQTNKNLLLTDEATVNTKPQLEIYADDVKCTHGATVGQMDPEAIFYLRARGLSFGGARRMLMHAFAGEIIQRIRCLPVREELDRLVWDRLEQNPRIAEAKVG